jgi:hypothetical protein
MLHSSASIPAFIVLFLLMIWVAHQGLARWRIKHIHLDVMNAFIKEIQAQKKTPSPEHLVYMSNYMLVLAKHYHLNKQSQTDLFNHAMYCAYKEQAGFYIEQARKALRHPQLQQSNAARQSYFDGVFDAQSRHYHNGFSLFVAQIA